MYGWIEPFYERADAAVEPGHVWYDQPVELPPRHALEIDRVDPKHDAKVSFTVAARTPGPVEHPPVHSLGLGAGEAALLARAARRLVVVLGGTTASELGAEGAPDAGTAIVVPVCAAERHDEAARRRIAAYGYTNAFYLPASPPLAESFARLDQAQPVLRAHLVEHQGLKLSPDALDALVEWFVAFSTNRLPEDSLILEYRRELLGD